MNNFKSNIIFIILCISIFGIIYINGTNQEQQRLPNDIRWVVESKEYKMLCEDIFQNAATMTKKLYSNNKQAVIMDLDETVLDNSQYQIELHEKEEFFTMKSWAKWVVRAEAKLIPGAKEFFDYIRKMNIQIIFISNRMNERLASTIRNMKKLGIYNKQDIYLLRLDKKDKKYIRRNEVYTGTARMDGYGPKNVVAYFGDAMGDFPEDDNLGKQYIFPNPMYGKW